MSSGSDSDSSSSSRSSDSSSRSSSRSSDRNRSRSPSQASERNRSWSPQRSYGWSPERGRNWSPDGSHRSQSQEMGDHSDRSPSTSPARDRNLWGMGLNPQDYERKWSDPQASTSGTSHPEIERLSERLSQMQEVGDDGEQHGGQGGGNGGGDGGNRGVRDGYDSDEDDKNGGSDAQKQQEAAAKLEENWEGITFSAKKFADHYGRHSSDWSPKLTEEQYVAKARELLSAPPDANIEGFVSSSGQYIFKYNNATNEFAIGRSDGLISTFYKPKTGRAYWLEQIEEHGGNSHVFGGK